MHPIRKHLSTFPETLDVDTTARALGFTAAEVESAIRAGHLVGLVNTGHWTIDRESLATQLEATHTKAVPYSVSRSGNS